MRRPTSLVARYAALLCLCMGISALENVCLPFLRLPLPGIKLGLSNLVILFCVGTRKYSTAFLLAVLRALLSALLFGNPITLCFSLCGGLLSVLAMICAMPLLSRGFTLVSVSVLGSLGFQLGQILVSLFLYRTAILYYTPLLLFSGILTGALLGLLSIPCVKRLKRFMQFQE